jgi:hypothetical protein
MEEINHGGRSRHTTAMGPHSRQWSIQQSTNIIFYGLASLNLEKTLTITINMTISARRVDNDVQRRCNNGETMGTVQPAGQNWRRRRRIAHLIGVGNDLG